MTVANSSRVLLLAALCSCASVESDVRRSLAPDSSVPTRPPPSPSNEERLAAASVTAFGLDLHRELARLEPDRDSFFAPYSLAPLLVLLAEGASGGTARELIEATRLPSAAIAFDPDGPALKEEVVHVGLRSFVHRIEYIDESKATDVWCRIRRLEEELVPVRSGLRALWNAGGETADSESDETDGIFSHVVVIEDEEHFDRLRQRELELCLALEATVRELPGHMMRSRGALWVDADLSVSADFERLVEERYGVGALRRFERAPEPTERLARGPVGAGVDSDRGMAYAADGATAALHEALEFAAGWCEEFEEWRTEPAAFEQLDGRKATVPMMDGRFHETARYAAFDASGAHFHVPLDHARDEPRPEASPGAGGLQVVELPYQGLDVSFLLVVPVDGDGLHAIEARLSPDQLAGWISALERRTVDVELPRFEVENTLELVEPLGALGVRGVFAPTTDPSNAGVVAGLSRAFPDEPEGVFVDAFVQKAAIRVDEEGTVVDVDTELTLRTGGRILRPRTPVIPEVVADRPFLFMVLDRATGTPLFIGRKVTAD